MGKKIAIVLGFCIVLTMFAPAAHATVCTGNAYHNITCEQFIPIVNPVCGGSAGTFSLTAGDRIIAWMSIGDSGGVTSITGGGGTWAPVPNLNNFTWAGATDAVWTTVVGTTGSSAITVNCTSAYEFEAVILRSSAGTVGFDCTSSGWVSGTNAVTASCMSTKTNDLGLSVVDWLNSQPTVSSGWSLVNDTTSEYIFALEGQTTAGSVSNTWTSSGNTMIAGMMVLNDGAAPNLYFAQTAAGSGSGADCADAKAVSGWASSQVPGAVLHLCGTITSALSVGSSGTSGNVIEVLFESGANITLATCSGNCLDIGSNSYILVDGGAGTPCGWNTGTNASEGTCNGFISETANGGGLAHQNIDIGINTSGSNVEIRNLGIYNIYQINSNFTAYPSSDPNCINVGGGSNVSIHDNRCHDASGFIQLVGSSSLNLSVYRNDVYNTSAIIDGAISSGTQSGTLFYGNRMHDTDGWDSYPSCPKHLDGWYMFGSPSMTLSNSYFYNNLFDGNWGQCNTARFFSQTDMTYSNMYIFNNIFAPTNNNLPGGDGEIAPAAASGTLFVFNNTFIVPTGAPSLVCAALFLTSTDVVKNNAYQCAAGFTNFYNSFAAGALDYNVYSGANNATPTWIFGGSFYNTFASWKTASGGDSHGTYTTSSLNLNATTYQPQSGSPAIGSAVNLNSTCNGQPNPGLGALCNDITGTARPTSAAWDAGAVNSGGTPTAPAPSCSPGSGTYSSTQSVSCSVSGAPVICYTTNGTTPATNGTSGCTTGTLYSGAISVSATEVLKAIAGGTGYLDGTVASYSYVISSAPPPAPGSRILLGQVKNQSGSQGILR